MRNGDTLPRFLTRGVFAVRIEFTTSGRGGTGRRASFRGWRAQARAGSNPAAPTAVDLGHPHGWLCSYKDVRIYEVSLTAQLSGTIVHVQNGPVAQRWSRGLIILWFSVRIRVGPPSNPRSSVCFGGLFLLSMCQLPGFGHDMVTMRLPKPSSRPSRGAP